MAAAGRAGLRLRADAAAAPAQQTVADDGSLPLVNIAFLLLAFFVMAGVIAAADPVPVAPPRAAAVPIPATAPHELLLAADGRLALDGVPVRLSALPAALAAPGLAAREGGLRLRADRDAEAGRLLRLLGILRAAGLREVTLVTVPLAQGPAPGAAGRAAGGERAP